MRHAAAHVVGVAAFSVIHVVFQRIENMLGGAAHQRDFPVAFAHQAMPQPRRENQRAAGADRVAEKRLRTVEGINETRAIGDSRPARGLGGAGGLERHFVEIQFSPPRVAAAFQRQAAQRAIGRNVVESMVVHACVADMRRHETAGVLPAHFEEFAGARGVEGKNLAAELESLGPFGPAANGVLAAACENRRPLRGIPRGVQPRDFLLRQAEEALQSRLQLRRPNGGVDFHALLPWIEIEAAASCKAGSRTIQTPAAGCHGFFALDSPWPAPIARRRARGRAGRPPRRFPPNAEPPCTSEAREDCRAHW